MALSKPEKVCITQQYLLCGTHECKKYFLFFCNQCHKPMCEPCRDKHLKRFETKNHIVVSYNQRKHQLPVEKCKIHPSKILDIHCKECNVNLCTKCCTLHSHRGHTFIDLETIYSDNWEKCQRKIFQVRQYFYPTAEELQHKLNNNLDDNKEFLDELKAKIKSDAESFKSLVDMVASKRLDEIKKLEKSFAESKNRQEETLLRYISYLDKLVEKLSGFLFLSKFQNNPLIFSSSEELEIKPIPETIITLVPYLFEPGKFTEYDVEKLIGKLSENKIKPLTKIKIKPMDTESALSKSFSVAKICEYRIPGVTNACHVSLNMPGKLWVSDVDGIVVQTDGKGNQLQKIETNGLLGCHTVTNDGLLIYADTKNKVIQKRTHANQTIIFIETGDWEPLSVHSSKINGNTLVGMVRKKPAIFFWMTRKFESKICRYTRLRKEIQLIQMDSKGQDLFDYPHYITENINGDICISDSNKNALVVVSASGQHRFSYTGQGSDFTPRGVCTDNLGQILVCDHLNGTVHLLHKNGQFLTLLRTEQHEKDYALCVSVDDKNNLYVGKSDNIVAVYKYIQ